MRTALITGGSTGLGLALATALAADGWRLVLTARDTERLDRVAAGLPNHPAVTTMAGDIADPQHRARVVHRINQLGALDLLANSASTLGPTPLRTLGRLSPTDLAQLFAVNVIAPFALTAALLPAALEAGVAFVPGEAFHCEAGAGASTLRLSYSSATPGEIDEGISRLAPVLREALTTD